MRRWTAWQYEAIKSDASFPDRALFFRIATKEHSEKRHILTGGGGINSQSGGRFNFKNQRASYCAESPLVAISEVLFHMYRSTLNELALETESAYLNFVERRQVLVVAEVKGISKLVHLDSNGFRLKFKFGNAMSGTMAVHPDATYEPFQTVAEQLRGTKCGIVYPSARHPVGACAVLFNDESSALKIGVRGVYERIPLRLQLVKEDFERKRLPLLPEPYVDRLHPTVGFFEFTDVAHLARVRRKGLLKGIPRRAFIEFARRADRPGKYPASVVVPVA